MHERLTIQNFTAFTELNVDFVPGPNVFVVGNEDTQRFWPTLTVSHGGAPISSNNSLHFSSAGKLDASI